MEETITSYSQNFWCESPLTHQTAQAFLAVAGKRPHPWLRPFSYNYRDDLTAVPPHRQYFEGGLTYD